MCGASCCPKPSGVPHLVELEVCLLLPQHICTRLLNQQLTQHLLQQGVKHKPAQPPCQRIHNTELKHGHKHAIYALTPYPHSRELCADLHDVLQRLIGALNIHADRSLKLGVQLLCF